MSKVDDLVNAGSEAVRAVLNRPKNLAKGPFPDSLIDLYDLAMDEMGELVDELDDPGRVDLERVKYEAADACAYLFALIAACDKALEIRRAEP